MSQADREVAARAGALAGQPVTGIHAVGAQHRWAHYQARLADGRAVFIKAAIGDLGGVFEAEGQGLRWLAQAQAVPVPEVLGWDRLTLVVSWIPAASSGRAAALRFGRDLARMHRAGAPGYGAPWPGFIASLPMPNDRDTARARGPAARTSWDWPSWYAGHRLTPYLRRAADAGILSASDTARVEAVMDRIDDLAGPAEPPSRIHGDCWSGNVIWSGGRGWLIDPAAHGGHRETDLAMLALFGAPFLDLIMAGYQETWPLAPGWRERVPLHQLHPLLVHVCLFGAGYRDAVLSAAGALLRS